MFIKLPETDKNIVALNLSAYDTVEIHEYGNSFLLQVSRNVEANLYTKTTVQSYPTYEKAFEDFEKIIDAFAAGQRVWTLQ